MKRGIRAKPIVVKHHDRPDEKREFEKGLFRLVTVAGTEIGRAEYEPGWRWSTHVGPIAGTASCEVEHVGIVLSGRAAVKMDAGEEIVMGPGDVFYVPAGHDSWVVGDEAYVSLHLQGASAYAARHRKTPARKRPAAKQVPAKQVPAKRRSAKRAGSSAKSASPRGRRR
jgi:quercetin dioxygenase-like cupin family protein